MNHTESVLVRQWRGYSRVHTDRKNLLIHVLTVPFFMLGTVAVLASPLGLALGHGASALALAAGGIAGMVAAVAFQGAGHRREHNPPEPFSGPKDVIARLFLEQWVTFPRYVLTGGLRRSQH